MNKQQFLAMSAVTDLKGFVDGRSTNAGNTVYALHSVPNRCKTVQIAASMDGNEFYVNIDKFKPILHPLSDLTKEIEHKGEKFVPIMRIYGALGIDIEKHIDFNAFNAEAPELWFPSVPTHTITRNEIIEYMIK